jgi:tetratricopeptide (TPR) repeat protein
MGHTEEIHEYFYTLKLRGEGRLEEAADLYRNRLRANAQDHKTRWNLAVVLSQQGKYSDALDECRCIVEAAPDNFTFRMTLVKVLLEREQWSDALSEAQSLMRLQPNSVASHAYVAQAYNGSGDITGAIRAYEVAITLPGANTEMLLDLGELYERVGRSDDASRTFRKATEKTPRFLEGCLRLGKALADCKLIGQARQHWQWVLRSARHFSETQTSASIDECVRLATEYLEKYPVPQP